MRTNHFFILASDLSWKILYLHLHLRGRMVFVDDDEPEDDERATEKEQQGDCFVKKEITNDSGENRYEVQEHADLWGGSNF